MSSDLTELIDKQAILELLNRYATALDSREWDLLDRVFLPDSTAEYSEAFGAVAGVEAIKDLVAGALGGMKSTQHVISNVVIELRGDEASSTCYLRAQHYLPGQLTGGNTLEVGGVYLDLVERTPQGWRIRHRQLRIVWSDGNHGVQVESRRNAPPRK